ncbi:MAG TPA: YbfB/YjiJ family MFS transporter [bacterium]
MINEPAPARPGPLRLTYAAMAANLAGTGLGRFAYTPLIPALIAAQWLTPGQAGLAAAANLPGYLAGAVLAQRMTVWAGPSLTLRVNLLIATASFFACAVPVSAAWFSLWRALAGASGAVLMVVAAPTALARVRADRRGLAGGVMFGGVGLGVVASGSVVPWVLPWGLTATWATLGVLSTVLTISAWSAWPSEGRAAATPATAPAQRGGLWSPALLAVYALYGLNAAGVVPHMVYLADYVARGLGQGIERAAIYWVLFGLGAVVGPPVLGPCADRFGFGHTLRALLLVEIASVLAVLVTAHPVALAASSFVVGGLISGIVPLVLGIVQRLLPGEVPRQRASWSIATACFALGLAGGGYGYACVFAHTGSHLLLFGIGAGALVLCFAAHVVSEILMRRAQPTAGATP